MKLRYRFANQVVGVFVILAVAVTVTLLILLGANQRWFRKNYEYYARFDTASDISVGMPITFRGFTIGRVTAFELTEENAVLVDFTIQEEYIDKVRIDSLIELRTSALGGGQLVFHQGRLPSDPPPEGSEIPRYDSKTGVRLRAENRVIDLRDTDPLNQALGQLDPILANVDTVLTNLGSLTGELDAALRGTGGGPVAGVLTGVERSVAQLRQTIARANTVIDETGDKISDLLSRVEGIADNLEVTSETLRDPTGFVTTLLDPQGSVATLLDDDNLLYDSIMSIIGDAESSISSLRESIADIQQFTAYLNTTQPQISGILEEGRQTLDTGQDVLEGLRNNPLLRGGIPEEQEQQTTFQGIRDEEF